MRETDTHAPLFLHAQSDTFKLNGGTGFLIDGRITLPLMLAALHLILYNDRELLRSIILSPVVTWGLLIGAGYGFTSLLRDLWRVVSKGYRRTS